MAIDAEMSQPGGGRGNQYGTILIKAQSVDVDGKP